MIEEKTKTPNFALAMAGLYIHIPYCKSKCVYCDFYSLPHGEVGDDYVTALLAEAQMRCSELAGESLTTIYVGGGTPSLLTPAQFRRLTQGVSRFFDLSGVVEFTVEVNPDDVTSTLIGNMKECGVNRVSMGVQSFDDNELRFMCRRHDSAQAVRAVEIIKCEGINNVSIDLIYGVPGSTIESWAKNVDAALALGVRHISSYNLTYEQGTRLWAMREKGVITEIDDDTCVAMFETLCDCAAKAGFEQYEISDFALPGFRSRHNSSYWQRVPYLGLGTAAHSFNGNNIRRYNPDDLSLYLKTILAGKQAYSEERLTQRECYDEVVMLSLRTREGIDLDALRLDYGDDSADYLLCMAQPHIANGNLRLNENRLALTPKGIMLSNTVTADLMSCL